MKTELEIRKEIKEIEDSITNTLKGAMLKSGNLAMLLALAWAIEDKELEEKYLKMM